MKFLIEVINNQVIVNGPQGSSVHHYCNSRHPYDVICCYAPQYSHIKREHTKERIMEIYKQAGDALGTSVKNFCNMLRGAANKAYIVPNEDLHKRFSFSVHKDSRGKIRWFMDPNAVERVNAQAPYMRDYIADDNNHLVGFGLVIGDAKVSKGLVGKHTWKRLCANSKTRNDLIVRTLTTTINYNNPQAVGKFARTLSLTPSTLLKNMKEELLQKVHTVSQLHTIESLLPRIVTYFDAPLCKIDNDAVNNLVDTIGDTARMRNNFNPNWSIKRIKREHEQAVKDQLLKTFPKTQIELANILPAEYRQGDFVATLLKSPHEIAGHGKQQHHCVANYAGRSARNEYAVYSLLNEKTLNISTVGIQHPDSSYDGSQHYMKYDRTVKNEERVAFGVYITKKTKKLMGEVNIIPIPKRTKTMVDIFHNDNTEAVFGANPAQDAINGFPAGDHIPF
jgi:hypothetical protein